MDGLEKVSIFAKLSKEHLQNLRKLAKTEKFNKDTAIFFQDDRSDSMYVLLSGAVKVFQTSDDGKERVLNTLGAGEIFGELGLLDASGRSASVATLEPSEVLTLTNQDLRALVKASPEVLWKVVEALCERVRQLSTETLDLSFRDVPYRVLRVLTAAASKHGQVTDAGILLSMDAKTLAGSVNCGIDQALRTLKKLEERGLIKVDVGHIVIPDAKALGRALEYEES
jgi:CRP/FNR family transcriptional regulator, cyclic AMP receptor protein